MSLSNNNNYRDYSQTLNPEQRQETINNNSRGHGTLGNNSRSLGHMNNNYRSHGTLNNSARSLGTLNNNFRVHGSMSSGHRSQTTTLNRTEWQEQRRKELDESREQENEEKCCVCGPRCCYAIIYFVTACGFLATAQIKTLPKLYYPASENLLPLHIEPATKYGFVVVVAMWAFHFTRRFAEVLFVHDYRRKRSCWEYVCAIILYWPFSIWCGWAVNVNTIWQTPPLYILVPGMVLYAIGEIGNMASHILLRKFRKKEDYQNIMDASENQWVIPEGTLFAHIDCPHYLFEIIAWLGFALAAFTLAGFSFWLFVSIVLIRRAKVRHVNLKEEFDGKENRPRYPHDRKAIVPCIC